MAAQTISLPRPIVNVYEYKLSSCCKASLNTWNVPCHARSVPSLW